MASFPADIADWQQKCLAVTGAILCVVAAILFVIGVGLWIAVGVLVSDPPDGSKFKHPFHTTNSWDEWVECS